MVIAVDTAYLDKRNRTEKQLFAVVEQNTPEDIKEPLFPQDEPDAFAFILNKEVVERLKLWDWYRNYAKEAQVSTAGIRGPQNILYPWDTRFPINQIGVILATLGKSLVAKESSEGKPVRKLAGCEVRYNSRKYVEFISRIQAANNIKTYVPKAFGTLPIWMASFLIFILDLDGGEHVTSSHSVSTKNATKDLNNQGSQYLPEESMRFVEKIEEILKTAETKGYTIEFSAVNHENIDYERLDELHDGIHLYVGYLKSGVATEANLKLIREVKPSIVVDCVGGCMYRPMRSIFERLGIADSVRWLHVEPDPLYHNIGKLDRNPKTGNTEFYDLGCDFSIIDVVKSAEYASKLKDQPIGTVIETTDPDGDRLIVCEIEDISRIEILEQLGITYLILDHERLLTVYTPNQAFLMLMDFHRKQLITAGLWEKYPRFMIKTTPSALAWDQWGSSNDVKVINVPVGFKEIASVMKKIEQQLAETPNEPVVVQDVYGKNVNLGRQPRLVFAGEESGGMITGPEELIRSQGGRAAIAMREKSAGESMVLVTALAAHCKKLDIPLSDYLETVFNESRITATCDVREDITYYNESEPNPEKLRIAKLEGEAKRDKNDLFFLGLAIALREGKININQARQILSETLPNLHFTSLEDIQFVGDGSYLIFRDMFVEVRKSGTDAKTKAYASGPDKDVCRKYAKAFGEASGNLTHSYIEHIGQNYLQDVDGKARQIYEEFQKNNVEIKHTKSKYNKENPMVKTNITFFIILIVMVGFFALTIVDAEWTVLREDDILRGDGIEGMLQDVYFMDNQNGLVVGNGGLMLVTTDGGKNWSKKDVNMQPPGAGTRQRPGGPPGGFGRGGSPTLNTIYFVNDKIGFITGERGTILKTEDGGETWNRKIARSEASGENNNPRPIRARLLGIQMISETTGFIAGSENTILKTEDGGETWIGSSERARVGETRNNLENIWFVSPSKGWIIGSFGTLLHTTNGGESWEKRAAGFDNNLFGIHFFDEKTGWICGQEGLILHTNDGVTWKQQETNSIDNLHDIFFIDNMEGWAVGDYSAVLHTTDGGKTWNASKAGGSGTLKGVHATDKNHCWTVDDWGVISSYRVE